MKKRFIAKKKLKKHHFKQYCLIFCLIASCFLTIRLLAHFTLNTSQADFLTFLLENQNAFMKNTRSNYSYFHQAIASIIEFDITDPLHALKMTTSKKTSSDGTEDSTKPITKIESKEVTNPTIYLYNTHQTEEYKATSFAEYNVQPNVMMIDYILKEQLSKKNYQVFIEEENVAKKRSELGLNYAGSYQVTRKLMEQAKKNYPSLNYFIDLHRDSISKNKTTITYQDTTYASILFIVGLENESYQENLDFTTKIHQRLNQKINGLSKGIYKKEGPGVNGVYNQDFSNRTILIELGGMENTIDEVYRTTILLSEVLDEVIQND